MVGRGPGLLDVSIVVHGESAHIVRCLQSLVANTQVEHRVHVVANTGENQSIQKVQREFPRVHVIVNERPRGFAANHNTVMTSTSGRYIALLNDDLIIGEGSLDLLVEFLENHPEAGLVGPRLVYPDGRLQPSTFGDPTYLKLVWRIVGLHGLVPPESGLRRMVERVLRPIFPRTFARYWAHDRVAEAHVLKGAAMVVRREAFEAVGPMAEVTMAYGEEYDWHLRFRQAGWKLYLMPQARMVHYQQQSTGGQGGSMILEHRRSILHYFARHRGRGAWQALRWTILLLDGLRWLLALVLGLMRDDWRERRRVYLRIVRMAWEWKL